MYLHINTYRGVYLRHDPGALPQRATRSSTSVMLTQPYSNIKTFGDGAFSVVALRLWNELPTAMREPLSLDNFKRKLIQPFLVKYYAADIKAPMNLYENRRYRNFMILIIMIRIILSNLSWNSHLDYISKKASKRLDILNRMSKI